MPSITHPHRITAPILLICSVLVPVLLVIKLAEFSTTHTLEDVILTVLTQQGVSSKSHETGPELKHRYIRNHHETHPPRPPHSQLRTLLSSAHHDLNPTTEHVRLSKIPILNITMLPTSLDDDPSTPIRHQKYFNPAIVPLPSYSKYPYLLVSRLVTSGLHQESHVCFAEICSPDLAQQNRPDTKACTATDLALSGERGGMRCITTPEGINIPPTPARRCSGSWASFPDIPGFHDPRIFWSGRGEPIIEVNSGSQYGCVGLWMVDLRAVLPSLSGSLRKNSSLTLESSEIHDKANDLHHDSDSIDISWLGPSIEYRYITEITKNPREARNEVEKNWVMFFPTHDEAWVQYDLMGRLVSTDTSVELAARDATQDHVSLNTDNLTVGHGPSTGTTGEGSGVLRPRRVRRKATVASSSSRVYSGLSREQALLPSRVKHGHFYNSSSTHTSSSAVSLHASSSTSRHERHEQQATKGGRTIAKLSSHGYTTPNLTHPLERSCFDMLSHNHTHDSLNNTGRWHHGTNSLRLVLCTRVQMLSRRCLLDTNTTEVSIGTAGRIMSAEEYEHTLTDLGLIVHIAFVHRKFSNEMELPMRYERYLVIWEARPPFQTVSISHHPILFGGEMARPWSTVENGLATVENDHEKRERIGLVELEIASPAYFTYTPSLAWTHRSPPSIVDGKRNLERGHEDLGTGYLDDEVLVGLGMDDLAQGVARIAVRDLLGDMRFCEDLYG